MTEGVYFRRWYTPPVTYGDSPLKEGAKKHSVRLFDQIRKNRQTLPNHLQADTIADPEISGTAEAVAGDQQEIFLFCFLGESNRIPTRSLHKEIEGAIGLAIS